MEAVVIITILILLQYTYFGYRVGAVRQATGTKAPASSGPPEFECMNRVHQNTLEQLVMFLPVLWLYAHNVNPLWAAGFGAVFFVGRFLYCAAYLKDPTNRTLGFMLTLLPSVVMAIWVLVVAVMSYL